jgi:hypothetical protein
MKLFLLYVGGSVGLILLFGLVDKLFYNYDFINSGFYANSSRAIKESIRLLFRFVVLFGCYRMGRLLDTKRKPVWAMIFTPTALCFILGSMLIAYTSTGAIASYLSCAVVCFFGLFVQFYKADKAKS